MWNISPSSNTCALAARRNTRCDGEESGAEEEEEEEGGRFAKSCKPQPPMRSQPILSNPPPCLLYPIFLRAAAAQQNASCKDPSNDVDDENGYGDDGDNDNDSDGDGGNGDNYAADDDGGGDDRDDDGGDSLNKEAGEK